MPFSDLTIKTLKAADLLRGRETPDRGRMAHLCAQALLADPVGALDEVQGKAIIVPAFREAIFGGGLDELVAYELDAILAPMTGPSGAVQGLVGTDMVLCTAAVYRTVGVNGSSRSQRFAGRFVTDDVDVVVEHYEVPAIERLHRQAATVSKRMVLGEMRIPALAGRHDELLGRAHDGVQAALPAVTT